ncbi:hypothetical protein GH714_019131 [Hevea brasiliensis]|uniref:Uncharacterized protein n=1 Tax=Hevea brasiliensis TaxID=3981 RepID=A0A6A6LN06_HEVBR|nr:hypothetical protein GH714_019131 [Hevea brasiliensis]
MGIIEKIKEIEAEMARTQKNKATEYHLGQPKAKIAKLRTQLLEPPKIFEDLVTVAFLNQGSSVGGDGFEVTKYGHGRVALIGFPRSGIELKIAGSFVAEQVEDKDNKEEIDGNMAFDDEYQEEDSLFVDLLVFSHNFSVIPLQCFDFDPLPGLPKVFGLAYAVKLHRDDIFSNRCKEALKYAIEKENEKVDQFLHQCYATLITLLWLLPLIDDSESSVIYFPVLITCYGVLRLLEIRGKCFDFDPLPGLPKVFGLAYAVKLHRDDIFSNRCKEALKYAIEKENEKVDQFLHQCYATLITLLWLLPLIDDSESSVIYFPVLITCYGVLRLLEIRGKKFNPSRMGMTVTLVKEALGAHNFLQDNDEKVQSAPAQVQQRFLGVPDKDNSSQQQVQSRAIRYEAGRWSEIKRLAFASYSYRTSVDLKVYLYYHPKDKWRNLLKASLAQISSNKGINSRKNVTSMPIPEPILLRVRELC